MSVLLRQRTTAKVDACAKDAGGLPRCGQVVKRLVDIVVSTIALIVLSPVLVAIACGVLADSGRTALYVQVRGGERGRPFRMYKFRTMVQAADERLAGLLHLNVHARTSGDTRLYKIPNDPRVTRFGRFLRRYSLDELPQLLNVLKGDMSLVGPRPLMLVEDRYVTSWACQRQAVKPGITGPWQVSGRNEIPFEEMMRMDCRYIEGWSLRGDLRLLMLTLPAVLRQQEAT